MEGSDFLFLINRGIQKTAQADRATEATGYSALLLFGEFEDGLGQMSLKIKSGD